MSLEKLNAQYVKCAEHKKAIAHSCFLFLFKDLADCVIMQCHFSMRIPKFMILIDFLNVRNASLTGDVRAPPLARLRARFGLIQAT